MGERIIPCASSLQNGDSERAKIPNFVLFLTAGQGWNLEWMVHNGADTSCEFLDIRGRRMESSVALNNIRGSLVSRGKDRPPPKCETRVEVPSRMVILHKDLGLEYCSEQVPKQRVS